MRYVRLAAGQISKHTQRRKGMNDRSIYWGPRKKRQIRRCASSSPSEARVPHFTHSFITRPVSGVHTCRMDTVMGAIVQVTGSCPLAPTITWILSFTPGCGFFHVCLDECAFVLDESFIHYIYILFKCLFVRLYLCLCCLLMLYFCDQDFGYKLMPSNALICKYTNITFLLTYFYFYIFF